MRSRRDRVLGGVAGGIARYFRIDPLWVRVGFVIASFVAAIGIVAYLVAWIVIPEEPPGAAGPDEEPGTGRLDVRQLVGFCLLGLGLLFIFDRIGLGLDGGVVWPLALIGIGGSVLWLRSRDQALGEAALDEGVDDAGEPTISGAPVGAPEPRPQRAWTPATPAPLGWPAPGSRWPTAPTPPAPPRPPRPPSKLGPVTFCSVLVVLGALWLLDVSDALDIGPGGILAVGLVGVGLGLIVGVWWGRSRGLIVLGLALTGVLTFVSVVDLRLGAGVGDETYRPTSVSELQDDYELGIGHLVVDLSALALDGRTETVDAAVGIGELQVVVPTGVAVTVDGSVGIGELILFGTGDDGFESDGSVAVPGREGRGELHLEVDGGIGRVEVLRATSAIR